jgi:DNA segregation ATPase FtsK/SpoIIIE-like protein
MGREVIREFYVAAVETACAAGFTSTRLLQDRFGIGYYRASILIEAMRQDGVIGDFDNEQLMYPLIEARGFYWSNFASTARRIAA